MGIAHSYTATGTNDPTKQVSVDRWNAEHAIVNELDLPLVASPTAPADNNIAIYGNKIGGRMMLMQMGPSGNDTSLQPCLGGNRVTMWQPIGAGSTNVTLMGMVVPTPLGTVTSRGLSAATILGRMARLGYVSAAAAGSLAGWRDGALKYTIGAGFGGFWLRYRFAPTDAATVAGARMFVGLNITSVPPANVEPNTLTNAIGLVQLSTSNNLHMYAAGASAGANLVDLGVNFPANINTALYELAMFAPPDGSLQYKVYRIDTGQTAEGTFTTGLPASSTFMGMNSWRTNNATALSVGIDICGTYVETDY